MDVGIGLPSTIRGVTRDQLLEWARRAEAAGFASVATIDRLAYPNLEPMTALAAAAAVTERVRLMTAVLLAPLRVNGALLAKQAASLEVLSNGRLTFGVAIGGREDDYEVGGVDFHTRGRDFDRMLEQWRGIWAGVNPVLGPAPVRPGGPELIIGGAAEASFRRVARYGAGWISGGAPPDQFAAGAEQVRAAWSAAGREGKPRLIALRYFALGPTGEQDARETLGHYYAFLGEWADAIAAGAVKIPEAVRAELEEFRAAGADEVVLFPSSPNPEQVDLLADAALRA